MPEIMHVSVGNCGKGIRDLTQYLIHCLCIYYCPFYSTGYYMYIETSSPRVAGDNAKLTFYVPGNKQPYCLKFYYHMYGDTIGTLNVFNGNMVVFTESGNQYNLWLKAERTIYLDYSVSCGVHVTSLDTGRHSIKKNTIK